MFSREYCKIFKNSVFIESSGGYFFFQFDEVTVKHWASALFIRSLINQKHNVRWFLLEKFVDQSIFTLETIRNQ